MPLIGTALAAVIGLIFAISGYAQGGPPDTDAFWLAAHRLRDGQPLYPSIDPNADEVFRYSPWFALAWVPLTYLPRDVTYAAWSGFLIACSVVSVVPVIRRGWAGLAIGTLVLGALLFMSAYGNPTPLVIAALTLSRVHPIVLGVAGSIKVYPLLLSAGFMAERRWRDVYTAVLTTAILWAPALVFGLDNYVLNPGSGGVGIWSFSPLLWLVTAAATAVVVLRLIVVRSQWAWVGGAALIALAVPRVWPGELAYLLPAVAAMGNVGRSPLDSLRLNPPRRSQPPLEQSRR